MNDEFFLSCLSYLLMRVMIKGGEVCWFMTKICQNRKAIIKWKIRFNDANFQGAKHSNIGRETFA